MLSTCITDFTEGVQPSFAKLTILTQDKFMHCPT